MKRHIAKHWHHWVSIVGLLLAGVVTGVGGATVYHQVHGGFRPGPLPPPVVIRGGYVPESASLVGYLTRTHDQGSSSSCVGQTLATIEEITWSRRGHRSWRFSSGFIWNQLNGSNPNSGTTYEAAFGILHSEGDARLRVFPPDGGSGYWVQPSYAQLKSAAPYRFETWRSINPADRFTLEYEIDHGRPVALAIPVTDSFYNHWNDPSLQTVYAQSGQLYFSHSITGVAYDPIGVTVQNSWGSGYGYHGRIRLSWGFLAAVGAEIVVASPYPAITHKKPGPTPQRTKRPAKNKPTPPKVKHANRVPPHRVHRPGKPTPGPVGHH